MKGWKGRWSRIGMRITLAGLGAMLGAAGGFALERALPRAGGAAVPQASASGHLQSDLEVVRETRRSIDMRSADATLAFGVGNRFGASGRVRYAVQLVDERGAPVQEPVVSPVYGVARGEQRRFAVALPRDLADGFYLARVIVAGRSGQRAADGALDQGFAVLDGVAYPMTDEEWYQHSLANQGAMR